MSGGADEEDPIDEDADPFDQLAADIEMDEDPDELFERAFEDASAESVDIEEVWERLEGGSTPSVSQTAVSEEMDVVSKRAYCESCKYMRPPPQVSCSHEGTDIVEYVDADHVLLRNCPIVAQRNRVESEESSGPEPLDG